MSALLRLSSRIDRSQALFAFLVVTALSAWIVFGAFHRDHHADSIVPILVSLDHWTPFFWDQGRFGMLVPLVASPLHHPLANLIAQCFLTCALGLAVFPLTAALFVRGRWFGFAMLGMVLFLAAMDRVTRFEYLGTAQPYGTSLGLGLLGIALIVFARSRILAATGFLLVGLAAWVTPTSTFAILPALLARGAMQRRETRRLSAAAFALLAGARVSRWLSAAHGEIHYLASPFTWMNTVAAMFRATGRYQSQGLALVAFAGGVVWIGFALTHRHRARAVIPIVVAAIASAFGMASVTKVQADPSERYTMVTWILLLILASWSCTRVLRTVAARARVRVPWSAASLLLVVLMAGADYGLPSLAGVRTDVDATMGKYTRDLIATRTTHFVGNYWRVWPAVFHFELTVRDGGGSLRLFGITDRAHATEGEWRRALEWRMAAPMEDDEILWWLRGYGLPFARPLTVEGRLVTLSFDLKPPRNAIFPTRQRVVAGME